MIMDLYGCNNYSSQLWNDRAKDSAAAGGNTREIIGTEEIVVKPNIATLLIGTRGETIETIEIKSGVKVSFSCLSIEFIDLLHASMFA